MKTIPLTQGKVALVDDEDYERVGSMKWYAHRDRTRRYSDAYYARRHLPGSRGLLLHLHTVITGWKRVDHINGDGLDCRRANMRPATATQNLRNQRKTAHPKSSRFKGVTWSRSCNKWQAGIKDGPRHIHLGVFLSEADAAAAYDEAATRIFGEFARPNALDAALGGPHA